MTYYIGIDSGSTNCKAVLFEYNRLLDTLIIETGWNPSISAKKAVDILLKRNKLSAKDIEVYSTGYGRDSIDFVEKSFTEITCHGVGGVSLNKDITGVIDIGGQDSKVIEVKNGNVVNFIMNDKCAAGTGRFLSISCNKLEILIEELDDFLVHNRSVKISSMCAVFAESEIIGLLAMKKDRVEILNGVLDSIVDKIESIIAKTSLEGKILFTGGLSSSKKLKEKLSNKTDLNIITNKYSIYAGAIGAVVKGSKLKEIKF